MKLVLGQRHRNLFLDYMLPKGLILVFVSKTAFVVSDMRSPKICTFWISFFFVRTVINDK